MKWKRVFYSVLLYRNDGAVTLEGRGNVSIEGDGQIVGRFIVGGAQCDEILSNRKGAGQLVENDDMYYFQGITNDGVYHSINSFVEVEDRGDGINFSVRIRFYSLMCNRINKYQVEGVYGSVVYWDHVKTPLVPRNLTRKSIRVKRDRFSRDYVLCVDCGIDKLTFCNQYDGNRSIKYISKKPQRVVRRLGEALYMLTGSVSHAAVCEEQFGVAEVVTMWSKSADFPTRAYPIVGRDPMESHREWEFFIKYYNFINRDEGLNWNEITEMQYASEVIASHSSRSAALILCSSIENMLVRKVGGLRLSNISGRSLEKIIDGVQSLSLGRSQKERCCGILRGALGRIRPIDKLYALEKRGVVFKGHAKAWKEIRNSAAHGQVTDNGFDQRDFDDLYRMYDLFHAVILYIVGYKGDFVVYSTPGWPWKRCENQKAECNMA